MARSLIRRVDGIDPDGDAVFDDAVMTGSTIDGTIIGGTTPAAGTYTTLTATGDVVLGDVSDAELHILDGATLTTVEINTLAGVTAGTPTASKAVVLDSSGNTITLPTFTDAAVGGTTAGTGITVVHTPGKSVFTLVDHALVVTDSGANGGHGSVTFFTFPEGHIRVESGLATFTKFSAQGTGSADTGVVDIGVGTTATATDNEVLSSTEQDICTKIDVTLDGAGDLTATVNSTINSTAAAFNGASTAIILSLNAAITAASQSANETFDVSGTITINWTDMGDT